MANTNTRTESVTVGTGAFDGYLALPPGGTGPGILLLQEIFGVNDFITSRADDLARRGYVVLAPDVFWRVSPHLSLAHDEASLERAFGIMNRYSSEVDFETKSGDLVAALDHLRALPEVAGHEVAVMGYCLGGFLSYLVAAKGSPDACVSYYGSGISNLLDLAGEITCPVLFHFGGNDPYIPNEQVEAIKAAFASRSDVTVRVEPEAGHAFENLLAPQFAVPEAAARSYEVTTAWLGEHLS